MDPCRRIWFHTPGETVAAVIGFTAMCVALLALIVIC